MLEFKVRVHYPAVVTMKVINYKEMTVAGLSWLDAQIEAKRVVTERPPDWDSFDVIESLSTDQEGFIEVYCPGQDDTAVFRLINGRLDQEDTEEQLAFLESVKDQLSPANYAWVRKDIEFRQSLGQSEKNELEIFGSAIISGEEADTIPPELFAALEEEGEDAGH